MASSSVKEIWNKKLKEQIIDYDNLKAEIEFIYKRGGNYS